MRVSERSATRGAISEHAFRISLRLRLSLRGTGCISPGSLARAELSKRGTATSQYNYKPSRTINDQASLFIHARNPSRTVVEKF